MSKSQLRKPQPSATGGPPEGDVMRLALSMCESGRLQYVSPLKCRLRVAFTAPEEDGWWALDLDEYVLPATRLASKCELSQEPQLAVATVLALDAYLCNAEIAKGTHKTIATMASTLAKCWEWGRLNGIYRTVDWTPSHFRRLEKQLGAGRWAVALQGEERVQAFLKTRPHPDSVGRTDSRFSIRGEMSMSMGTNMGALELGFARNSIHRYLKPNLPEQDLEKDRKPSQPGLTWLLQAFWAINLLSSLAAPYGFKFTPFPDPMARATRLAKPNSRTPTLSVDQAIGLLVHSLKCVNEHTDAICDLVYEVGRIALEADQAEAGAKARLRLIERLWEESAVRAAAVDVLGVDVSMSSMRTGGKVTVPHLVDTLMSASVVLIAGLNARRKDEIIHQTLGLRRDSIRPINQDLSVYEGTFYIEKTLKSYAPYFVNQATFDAFSALQRLEQAQLDVEALLTDEDRSDESLSHSMFWSRSFAPTPNILQPRVWFTFTFDSKGTGRAFTAAALGEGLRLTGGGAHVFRRFYAIIYYYRFEHGGLLALRYQLAHLNCDMTKQYVTSAMIDAIEARIPIALRRTPEAVRAAINNEWQAVDEVIREVGSDKLYSVIVDLLGGQAFSGGFPRLVEKLHRRFSSDLDYSAMDTERQARRLQQRLTGRGHSLRPLPHADCAAGASKARGARCSNSKGSGPAPENSSVEVCRVCPYSWTSEGHVEGLKLDLEVLDNEIAEAPRGTLLHQSWIASRDNLQHAIWLHEERISGARV